MSTDKKIQRHLQSGVICLTAVWGMTVPACRSAQAQYDSFSGQHAASPGVYLSLQSAIELALRNNRDLLLARDAVRESGLGKRIAQSHLYPLLKNQSSVLHITQLEGVTIPEGAFSQATPVGPLPGSSITVAQGAATAYTSGTELAQPLTQLFRIAAGVKAAEADLRVAEIRSDIARDSVSLQVRQLYYTILVEQARSEAAAAAVEAVSQSLEETHQGVVDGRLLEEEDLERQTELLDKKEAAVVSQLNLNNAFLRLEEAVGLPLGTRLTLDPETVGVAPIVPTRDEAEALALDRSPSVLTARQGVEKAQAGLKAAREAYVPDITGLARYSYQSGVPFLQHNFGTFGATVTYDLFNGGEREAKLHSAQIKLAMARIELKQVEDNVRIEISAAYDKSEQLAKLLEVARQALTVREESLRVRSKRAEAGAELRSGVAAARSALMSARANLLDSNLNLHLAQSDIERLLGMEPE